jgi:hypothetical protein
MERVDETKQQARTARDVVLKKMHRGASPGNIRQA